MTSPAHHRRKKNLTQQGSARSILLVLICAAIAGGGFWYYQARKGRAENPVREPEKQFASLSDGSKAVLGRLGSPVEIHFYSLLDPATVPESIRDFAVRVDQLLAAYEREGNGKVMVTRRNSRSEADANAAAADGIQAFNRDKGDVCYFGITVVQDNRKESFPLLAPEWEPALESDLSRAIARLTAATPPTQSVIGGAPADVSAIDDVKQAVPDFGSVSIEEGTRILREAALQEFKKTAEEMSAQVKAAQERLTAAQNGQSAAEQQAAMKELQQVQTQHTEKLKEIAAGLQARIAALEQLKRAPQPGASNP